VATSVLAYHCKPASWQRQVRRKAHNSKGFSGLSISICLLLKVGSAFITQLDFQAVQKKQV
jgi:hypothetical protein